MMNALQETGLHTVGRVIDAWRAGMSDSYQDYTRPARVTPLMIVDSSLHGYEHISTVTQSLLSAFSAYYLLSWNMLTITIDNVSVARHLDKLNPNRNVKDSILQGGGVLWNLADNQNYQHALPRFGAKGMISNEAKGDNDDKNDVTTPAGLAAKATKVVDELTNLSVGKFLEVQISNGKGGTATIPVLVQLQASMMIPDLMASFLTTGNKQNDIASRIIKYKSDQIGLLDLLTSRDIVKEHKKTLWNDKTGVYTAITQRQRNNKLSALLTANPTVANASNLLVVSEDTVKKAELEMNGRFDDFRLRQKLFNETGLFIVAVVDPVYDMVKFYTNGIAESSELSIKDCRAANQKEGSTISDILKAYSLGKTPGF